MGARSQEGHHVLAHPHDAALLRTVAVHKRVHAGTLALRGGQRLVRGDELPAVAKGAGLIRSGDRSPAKYEAVLTA
ncbi:hypothetical protein OG894_40945 [Streptomyces sp. NBC_01724]|uniref:hypothetical protein n=1 Tax=unclassified Streptomyces TaxID=2593676 RepID=UPI002E355BCC|nr:hypothetical protein [Streptomyces sp. NBC_01724]WTE49368.1 hypothetical protein OG987_00845 [Streptomyces sp. NBC_01620]WTI84969.1 hypothetical protein OHB17_01335 [Streptomyces sp. NBC_00724]